MPTLHAQKERGDIVLCFTAESRVTCWSLVLSDHPNLERGALGGCQVKTSSISPGSHKIISTYSFKIYVLLKLPDSTHVLSALIDSRAVSNFISLETIQRLNLPTEELQHPLRLQTIGDGPIGEGLITTRMLPLNSQLGAFTMKVLPC